MQIKFVRKRQVLDRFGFSLSPLYKRVARGEFPSQVKLGDRASAWLEHELDQMAQAYAVGMPAHELRVFVASLEAKRKTLLNTREG